MSMMGMDIAVTILFKNGLTLEILVVLGKDLQGTSHFPLSFFFLEILSEACLLPLYLPSYLCLLFCLQVSLLLLPVSSY